MYCTMYIQYDKQSVCWSLIFNLQVYSKYTWANPLHVDIFPDGKFDLFAQLRNVKLSP